MACPWSSPIASLTPESVTRFLVGGFMEVLRSWMEDPTGGQERSDRGITLCAWQRAS